MHPALPTRPARSSAGLLPADVALVETTAERAYAELFPAEAAVAAHYAPARRAEFATGRACAREALAALGWPPGAIPPGPGGDPEWPAGAVGSITHCPGYRAAAVGLATAYAGIGLDAEPDRPLPAGVLGAVAGPGELAAVAGLPADGTSWDRVLFCAKEAAYKAWYPMVHGEVLATGIVVRLEPGGGFAAVIGGRALSGRWITGDGLVRTAVTVPRRSPAYRRPGHRP
jgi:4'-phosphopantetheinyl transferase EntD